MKCPRFTALFRCFVALAPFCRDSCPYQSKPLTKATPKIESVNASKKSPFPKNERELKTLFFLWNRTTSARASQNQSWST